MSKQISDEIHRFKKIFLMFLVLDFIGLIQVGAAVYPIFKQLEGYGQLMLRVVSVLLALIIVVMLTEILAKIFLLRSTSPKFSWSSVRKGYFTVAKLLLLFNLADVIFNLLAVGGEGATLISQVRLYLKILVSLAEMIAAFCYLRTAKKIIASITILK